MSVHTPTVYVKIACKCVYTCRYLKFYTCYTHVQVYTLVRLHIRMVKPYIKL